MIIVFMLITIQTDKWHYSLKKMKGGGTNDF